MTTLWVVIHGSASRARAGWSSPVMSHPCGTSSSRMCSANHGTFMVRPVQATSASRGAASAAVAVATASPAKWAAGTRAISSALPA